MPRVPPAFAPFAATLPFQLSAYQAAALDALAQPGVSVVVVAPTGSGKSIVADAAIWQALGHDGSAAYTSPLKALANQRFAQLTARWGNRAGLLTGDRAVRPASPARVMTAEVYRTLMLRREDATPPREPGGPGSRTGAVGPSHLRGERNLLWAIFDEAHYLSDAERGAAWEEAILATPPATRILCLSATVGAPERLAGWLRWLGRETVLVEAAERPVPLRHYLAVRGDLRPVLDEHGRRVETFPFAGGWALAQRRSLPGRRGEGPRRPQPALAAALPTAQPDEWVRQEALNALRRLRERDWTPTIAFTSSRREAERLADAARALAPDGAAGVAYHHAGLHPRERQRVEERLRAGELWLVCGTTTLAAGLDVPARSVLVTNFGRFDGRGFRLFSPAEYRQLTGRAGRLGKDEMGAAVLLPSPWHSFEEAFRKLTAPLPPIASAFHPGYPTALAWWGHPDLHPLAPSPRDGRGGDDDAERDLALMLARTFAAYLRRHKGVQPPPPVTEPDGPSLLQARALGRLLARDGLLDASGVLTPRGRFVLDTGGVWEGRLLLRLLEDGVFDPLAGDVQAALLALLAEGPSGPPEQRDDQEQTLLDLLRAAHAQQVAAERAAGAPITPPLPAGGPRTVDVWRRRAAVTDLLERALRAARSSCLPLSILDWGPGLLAQLEQG